MTIPLPDDLNALRSMYPEDLARYVLDTFNPLDLPPLVLALAEALHDCAAECEALRDKATRE